MKTKRFLTAAAILVAAALSATVDAGRVQAGELNREQQQTILQEANTLYKKGTAHADDQALSKEAYQAAAAKYQTLVDDGVHTWQMYFNLGNAYLQSGSLGRAIVNYERAAAMTNDKAVHANLAHAKSLVKAEAPVVEAATGWDAVVQKLDAVPSSQLLMIAAASWVCFWFVMCLRIPQWQRLIKTTGIIAAGLFVSATILMAGRDRDPQLPAGVVTVDQVQLREGNGTAFGTKSAAPLAEGVEVQVVEQRGDWFNVRLPDGTTGWLTDSQMDVI